MSTVVAMITAEMLLLEGPSGVLAVVFIICVVMLLSQELTAGDAKVLVPLGVAVCVCVCLCVCVCMCVCVSVLSYLPPALPSVSHASNELLPVEVCVCVCVCVCVKYLRVCVC